MSARLNGGIGFKIYSGNNPVLHGREFPFLIEKIQDTIDYCVYSNFCGKSNGDECKRINCEWKKGIEFSEKADETVEEFAQNKLVDMILKW